MHAAVSLASARSFLNTSGFGIVPGAYLSSLPKTRRPGRARVNQEERPAFAACGASFLYQNPLASSSTPAERARQHCLSFSVNRPALYGKGIMQYL